MAEVNTLGLVLRRADYGDHDRMITLFTPTMGRLDAAARGCRRAKSQLLNATEPFTSGEFILNRRGTRYYLESCRVSESFYELRTDYDRLRHGAYWLKLLDASVMPEVPYEELFYKTITALAHLNYSELPLSMLTMAFEMHFMSESGYYPRMDSCVICGKPINEAAKFSARLGGAVCYACNEYAPGISNGARRIMLKLPRTRFEAVSKLDGHPDWREAARLFRKYVEQRVDLQKKFAPDV